MVTFSRKLTVLAGSIGVGVVMIFAQPLAALADQTINDNLIVNGSLYSSSEGRFDGGMVTMGGRVNILEHGTDGVFIGDIDHTGGVTIGNSTDSINIVSGNWGVTTGGVGSFASLAVGGASPLVFDGATVDTNKTTFAVTDPTGTRTVTVPDLSGTMTLLGNSTTGSGSFVFDTGATMTSPTINTPTLTGATVTSGINSDTYATATNCNSIASPAACGSAVAGMVALPNGTTSLTVNDTAVTANSEIFVQEDFSLGARLGITCNTTTSLTFYVANRTAGTSFQIKSSTTPQLTKACLSYHIIN